MKKILGILLLSFVSSPLTSVTAKGQGPVEQDRLTAIAQSAKVTLDNLPACEEGKTNEARADEFTIIGDVFTYVATHYGYTPGEESYVNFFVGWGLDAYKKSAACHRSHTNRYPSERALWLIEWELRWLSDNGVAEEQAGKWKQDLEVERQRISIPEPPECPTCLIAKPCPELPPPPKTTGYKVRYGGRLSLGLETGVYIPRRVFFGERDVLTPVHAAFGLSAGWRIPWKIHVFEVGGRFHHTVARAKPNYDYPIGLVTLVGGYGRYGVAPLQGKISFHGDLQLGMAMLPDHSGTVHLAPGLSFCALEEVMCLSLRYVWTPASRDERTTGSLLQLGADVFRIVDYVLKRKERK